jgi:hypothetical protein
MAPAGDWQILREAEQADAVVAPAHVVPNPQARQGSCVMLSEGGASVRNTLRALGPEGGEKSGELDFDFEVPKAGQYRVWMRAQWHCVCANSFYLLTTGTAETLKENPKEAHEDQAEPYRVKVSVPPRTWRWLPAATCEFAAGKQKLRIVQAGHEALIDAVMVTADPNEQPPGYEDQSRTCVFELGKETAWKKSSDGGRVCPLGASDWADFQLDFLTPADLKAAGNGVWGVSFAGQPNGTCYKVLFTGSGKVELLLVENGKGRSLASKECGTLDPGESHWVRVVRLGDGVSVAVDGSERLAVADNTLGGGAVALVAEKRAGYDFQGLRLTPLKNYLEHFQAGMDDWKTLEGNWRAVQAGEQGEMSCMGSAPNSTALIVPAWDLGGEYTLNAPIQLSGEGAAGFAFDVRDSAHYHALLLQWGNGRKVEAQILNVAETKRDVLLTRTVDVDPRQWHTLRLTRRSDLAIAQVDAIELGKCRIPGSNESGRVGLVVAPGGAGLFGAVSGRSLAEPGNRDFLVEGVEAPITLCQWKTVEGSARVQGHPAVVFLSAAREGERPRFELRRETQGDVRLEATFFKYGSAAAAPADSPGAIPGVVLPPLPEAPRVGIVFNRQEAGEKVEYALLSDWEGMREVILERNGKILKRACTAKARHPEGYKLFLQLQGNELSGGVAGVSEIRAGLPEGAPASATTQVAVTTRNFAAHDEAGIVELRLSD